MALTIELTPEMETRLQREAARRGQEPAAYALTALQQVLGLTTELDQPEAALIAEWRGASHLSLQELWDNDEDAVYDHL